MIKEIVIAAYDRDLSWLDKINSDVKKTIYRKGPNKKSKYDEILIEPNLGRDVHTFFNHICLNYNNMSDYTFFAQDYPFDHFDSLIDVINGDMNKLDELSLYNMNGYWGFWTRPRYCTYFSRQYNNGHNRCRMDNGSGYPDHPNLPVDKLWDGLFNEPKPNLYEFVPGGHIILNKEKHKIRSLDFYKKICEILITDPESPWIIERYELSIFNEKLKTKL